MNSYKVVLKRTTYAEVTVKAETSAAAKEMLKDEEVIYNYFTSGQNYWAGPDLKVHSVERIASET